MNPTNDPIDKEDRLWKIARKRVAFRKSLYLYCVVNIFLWLIWYFTSGDLTHPGAGGIPWPIYPMLGWGLGVAVQYYNIRTLSLKDPVTAEYEKLKRKHKDD